MANIPIIKTINISKEFSGVKVLNDINIEVHQGEVFGIIGENGAGKSTFVKILSGAYTPTEGDIYFNGKKVIIKNTREARNLGISIIPQEFNSSYFVVERRDHEKLIQALENHPHWKKVFTGRDGVVFGFENY